MRFVLWFILTLLLVTALGCGGSLYYFYTNWAGPGPSTETKSIIIARGSGVASIADQLEQNTIITSPIVFKIAVRLGGNQGQLKAGEYEFQPAASMMSIIEKLSKGDVVARKITIPEGLTSWQIVQIINAAPALTGTIETIPAEGSLLPETYPYIRDQNRAEILRAMQTAMTKTIEELWPQRDDGLPFDTAAKAVALASVVEKETGIASERATIAGVFVNRLRLGMPLQSDPTVIYAITKGKVESEGKGPLGRRLLRADLVGTDSPYNTYKYPGLPAGPIANPGRAAIEATLHPEAHGFLYFVAKGDGGHVFSSNLAEHEKNAAQWRKIRKEQGN